MDEERRDIGKEREGGRTQRLAEAQRPLKG